MIENWLEDLENEVRACCSAAVLTPAELAARLGVSTSTATSYILLLASEGRLQIERLSLPALPARTRPRDVIETPAGVGAFASCRAA